MAAIEDLSNSVRRSTAPILSITRQFYPFDTEPCILTHFQGQDWYHGTGITPQTHPASRFPVLFSDLCSSVCGFCASPQVLVVALQTCVNPMSGDLYYDYEIVCQTCGGFTAFAYAEN